MDDKARQNLVTAVSGQQSFVTELTKRLIEVADFVFADRPEYWDALFLAQAFEDALKVGSVGLACKLPWSTAMCSAIVDEAVYSRGLLMHAARLARDFGVFHNDSDAEGMTALLRAGSTGTQRIIVAYFDYVATSGKQISVWSSFATLGRQIAKLAQEEGFSSYYWRSSDTFYLYRIVSRVDVQVDCSKLIELLVQIQKLFCLKSEPWMWQMGVSIGPNTGIGDIFLPGASGERAAALMKGAIDKIRGGGALCVTRGFWSALPQNMQQRFMPIRGSKRNGYYYVVNAAGK